MIFLTWLLTAVLVLDCVFLILLVLIQLPKKEAGAGMAFGGAATDALFGAGSGTALTKITKYASIVFFVIALGLSIITSQANKRGSTLDEKLKGTTSSAASKVTPPPITSAAPQATPADKRPPTEPAPSTTTAPAPAVSPATSAAPTAPANETAAPK